MIPTRGMMIGYVKEIEDLKAKLEKAEGWIKEASRYVRLCECGGKLHLYDRGFSKSTGEASRRMKCAACGETFKEYQNPATKEWVAQVRNRGPQIKYAANCTRRAA